MSFAQIIKNYDESLEALKKAQLPSKKTKKDIAEVDALSDDCTEKGYLVSLVKKAKAIGLDEGQIKLLAKSC